MDDCKIDNVVHNQDIWQISLEAHMRKYKKSNLGYLTLDNVKDTITRTRQIFETSLFQHKGPNVIPTIFRNHPERFEFVIERERRLCKKRKPKKPPAQIPVTFSFADDVGMNIVINLLENEFQAYKRYATPAKLVCLKREICGEQAFEEMLSRQPHFYSDDGAKLRQSAYADPDPQNWIPPSPPCNNHFHFIVDFSVILPENKVSTAYVVCYDCGRYVETVLYDTTIEAVVKDISHNILQLDLSAEGNDVRKVVIRLPTRNCSFQECSFVEGLMGVTPLTGIPHKPSVFVRTRLFYLFNLKQRIHSIIHRSPTDDKPFKTILGRLRID
uniref:Uncharacterized protein n=1 Tax=Homalodisca liturata TaxID=320908 RepID=A0A1B6HGG9_9HEMI